MPDEVSRRACPRECQVANSVIPAAPRPLPPLPDAPRTPAKTEAGEGPKLSQAEAESLIRARARRGIPSPKFSEYASTRIGTMCFYRGVKAFERAF